jgi:hypothetical protein
MMIAPPLAVHVAVKYPEYTTQSARDLLAYYQEEDSKAIMARFYAADSQASGLLHALAKQVRGPAPISCSAGRAVEAVWRE